MNVRHVSPMKHLIIYAYCFAFAFAAGGLAAQGDDDLRPPRNVRIVRERSGESNDRLVAKWDAPSSGNFDYYWFRWRSRESGSTDWGKWQYRLTNATSENIVNLAGGSDALMKDYQAGVRNYYNGATSDEARATWRSGSSSRRSRRTGKDDILDVPYVPKPALKTCELLSNSGKGISVSSPQGLGAGIQCQQIGAAGIGVASVIEAGIVDAVDVWGGGVATAEVCFSHNEGEFLFLDASTAPRSVTVLPAHRATGMICTRIDRAGSVVLIPPSETSAPSPSSNDESAQIEGCYVKTNFILNLRDAPTGSNVLAWIPYNVTLRVTARSGDWLKVNWNGISGWISSDLVRSLRACA